MIATVTFHICLFACMQYTMLVGSATTLTESHVSTNAVTAQSSEQNLFDVHSCAASKFPIHLIMHM